MSDLSFKVFFFTYYATNLGLIEMLSNFPINMNCIFLRSHGRIFAVSSSYVYKIRVKGGNSGTLSYFSNFAYNSGFMQHRYGALASSIILLWSNALYVCLLAPYIFIFRIL